MNIPVIRAGVVDPPLASARFRGTADSTAHAVWSLVPLGQLHQEKTERTLRTGVQAAQFALTALSDNWTTLSTQSQTVSMTVRDTLSATRATVQVSLPATARYLRADALAEDPATGQQRAARGMLDIVPLETAGFSTSDVVVARTVRKPSETGVARWQAYDIDPLFGARAARGQPIALLWETYQPTPVNGAVRYRVQLSVERVEARGVRAVVVRALGGVRGAVMGGAGSDPRTVTFDRTLPAFDTNVETLTLDLGDVAAGAYQVRLVTTDLQSGRVVTRVAPMTVGRR